ncbi:hypothetical protein Emed_007537 [Eimeria media]
MSPPPPQRTLSDDEFVRQMSEASWDHLRRRRRPISPRPLRPPDDGPIADTCPRCFSPPHRMHYRFGFYQGPPRTGHYAFAPPPPFQPPEPPFGRENILDGVAWFAVILGPGYKPYPDEPLWLVQATLRDIHREMIYDEACRELYPDRFLRRFVEVDMPSDPDDVDVRRSHCLAPHTPELDREMEEDFYRRLGAFQYHNADYPTRRALGSWPERPDYAGPHLRLVVERYDSSSSGVAPVVAARRYLPVRYPTDLPRFPGARAQLHEGPSRMLP